jgi:diadenosine tetraphosphate (Ap4A) HIT family hydrolase
MSSTSIEATNCFICRKHLGKEKQPPGGYIHGGHHFLVCHAPLKMGTSGTLFVESKRHFLDYAEMRQEEAAELFEMLRRLFPLMKKASDAERIYSLAMMDGIPHFHLWLIPRKRGARFKGVRYLMRNYVASGKATRAVASKIKRGMKSEKEL